MPRTTHNIPALVHQYFHLFASVTPLAGEKRVPLKEIKSVSAVAWEPSGVALGLREGPSAAGRGVVRLGILGKVRKTVHGGKV